MEAVKVAQTDWARVEPRGEKEQQVETFALTNAESTKGEDMEYGVYSAVNFIDNADRLLRVLV
ncbi:hypothetical protein ACO22_01594 [Paracoccidioides brasiliensis]|uniref:Uncharacterized protein n=1 Tax=Paracoccidioides brasiliensis TaxID=121759 RepID=A0A1D2JLF0_PARBR|nr:hypothetical protein ACO22_01594 [Paracoccidioides brasiliensis]